MIAIPAVDLREGRCVQLVGGSYAAEKVRLDDPVRVAARWTSFGFTRLHVVDLDAATGRGNNDAIVREIVRASDVPVQVGGGVRTDARAEELLRDGATYVIVGTRAIEDPAWIAELATAHPASIVVAADVRNRNVVTRGWKDTTKRDVVSVVGELSALPLAGLLVTAVHKEGLMQGPDIHLMEDVVAGARVPVYASGGIRGRTDLDSLSDCGVAGAVIGMALYTGALDPTLLAEEYGS
ncbi:MAG TPA: 1-(5-phosphoribosyl)-5-[(5-phosphoribosylamino)methylideneamino]imidazole-4-carboxamide isomerase [Gemmatimonadaceae bacterium]|nr:1-(5-phosphoribosyl)-5-[(5-phosphoribosylamino)methylideneamino]imidazole-4-carboxamide isomerase [Gemmatimonadaceae bacterium]